jgi:hypothetical protein
MAALEHSEFPVTGLATGFAVMALSNDWVNKS